MNNLKNSDWHTVSLGSSMPTLRDANAGDPCLFITISPNPKVKIPVIIRDPKDNKQKKGKVPYYLATHYYQYQYCMKYLNQIILPNFNEGSQIVGTFELNSSNLIHLHLLVYDVNYRNKYDIMSLRQTVLSNLETIRNLNPTKRPKKNYKDYMNNIVYIDKPAKEILQYMDKDHDQKGTFFKQNICNYYTKELMHDYDYPREKF